MKFGNLVAICLWLTFGGERVKFYSSECFFFFAFYVSFRFCIVLFWCFVGMGKKIYLCWTAEGRNKVSKS